MSAHTPGPWKIDGPFKVDGAKIDDFYIDAVGQCVARIPRLWDNAESNARLIAAAPRMLTLLRSLSERLALRAMEDHRFTSMNEKADIDEARAILRDVEGS